MGYSNNVIKKCLGEVGPEESMLMKAFLQLMRTEYEHFQLCEFYAFWCVAARKQVHGKHHTHFTSVWPSFVRMLSNRQNYECMRSGLSSIIANQFCNELFGHDCL